MRSSGSKDTTNKQKEEWEKWRCYGDGAAKAKTVEESKRRNGDTDSPPGMVYYGGYVTETQRRLNVIEAKEGKMRTCITCWT